MLIALSKDQNAFFEKNGYLELEGFFSPRSIEMVRKKLLHFFHGAKWDKAAFTKTLFETGHGIYIKEKEMQKSLSFTRLAAIASSLAYQPTVRYVSDQLCAQPFMLGESPLQEANSVKGALIGCFISLGSLEIEESETTLSKGSVIFYRINGPVPEALQTYANTAFWFILFGGMNLQYLYNEKDFHTHDLKKLGYVFGDSLKQKTHPILYP